MSELIIGAVNGNAYCRYRRMCALIFVVSLVLCEIIIAFCLLILTFYVYICVENVGLVSFGVYLFDELIIYKITWMFSYV